MLQNKLAVESAKIEDIKSLERNAKKHPPEQIEQIKNSIKAFGFNDPIAVDENSIIIEGHGRLEAAKKLGMEDVPIIRLDHLNKSQKKAYIIAHNKLCMNSDFDIDKLKLEFADIEKDDWELTG